MYLFVPCDKKSHGTEISFPIRSKRLSHPHPHKTRGKSRQNSVSKYSLYFFQIFPNFRKILLIKSVKIL